MTLTDLLLQVVPTRLLQAVRNNSLRACYHQLLTSWFFHHNTYSGVECICGVTLSVYPQRASSKICLTTVGIGPAKRYTCGRYQTCWKNLLVVSLLASSTLSQDDNSLFQACKQQLGTSSANTSCWQAVRFCACSTACSSSWRRTRHYLNAQSSPNWFIENDTHHREAIMQYFQYFYPCLHDLYTISL